MRTSVQARMINVIGTLLMAVSQWLQIILITRLLGLYEVGLFSYFLALAGPLVLFSRFSLSRLLPTQRRLNYDYIIFRQFRDVTNYAFIVAALLLVIVIDFNIYETFCFFLFIIFKYYENKEDFIYAENISESRIHFLGTSKILKSILIIVLFSASIFIFKSLAMAIFSLLAGQVMIYYLYDRKYSFSLKVKRRHMTFSNFRNIFALGVGLSVVEFLSSMVTNVPRYVLEYFHSVEVLGIFATIMYFTVITNNIVIAINEGVIAGLAREARVSTVKFYRSYLKLCGMFLVLIIIGEVILISIGNELLILVYGDAFSGYRREMLLLGVLLFFVVYTTLFEMALNVFNLYMHQVVMQTATFFITAALSLLVIIPFGLTGAFIVAILTHGLLMAGQIGVLLHHWYNEA